MQSQNRVLDDLARVASGAIGVAAGMREEIAARLREQRRAGDPNQLAAAVILTALLGAAMSSIDSVLLVLAGALQRDVVEVIRGPFDDLRSLRFTRLQVIVFALVTALVALRPPGDGFRVISDSSDARSGSTGSS